MLLSEMQKKIQKIKSRVLQRQKKKKEKKERKINGKSMVLSRFIKDQEASGFLKEIGKAIISPYVASGKLNKKF